MRVAHSSSVICAHMVFSGSALVSSAGDVVSTSQTFLILTLRSVGGSTRPRCNGSSSHRTWKEYGRRAAGHCRPAARRPEKKALQRILSSLDQSSRRRGRLRQHSRRVRYPRAAKPRQRFSAESLGQKRQEGKLGRLSATRATSGPAVSTPSFHEFHSAIARTWPSLVFDVQREARRAGHCADP